MSPKVETHLRPQRRLGKEASSHDEHTQAATHADGRPVFSLPSRYPSMSQGPTHGPL